MRLPPPASVDECLAQARREVLSDVEREELEASRSTFDRALNPRNEAAALSALYAPRRLARLLASGGGERGGASLAADRRREQLDALADSYVQRTGGLPPPPPDQAPVVVEGALDAETAALAAWATQGLLQQQQQKHPPPAVAPAVFERRGGGGSNGGGARRWRGLAATRDVRAGEVVLSLPMVAASTAVPTASDQEAPPAPFPLAITYASARASDLGRALSALALDDESLALLWTMADRRDPDSPHAPFWAALPQESLGTPLGAGVRGAAVREALGGTALGERAAAARAHLDAAYAALQPAILALVRAYPQHLKPAWFSRASFLWASELWYAYAMQLALPATPAQARGGGAGAKAPRAEPVPALVPLTSLANHGAWPHAVAYSDCTGGGGGEGDGEGGGGGDGGAAAAAEEAAGWQRVRVFRPLKRGEELLISYGPLSNDELLLFYGFALERNPFDARAVRKQLREAALAAAAAEALAPGEPKALAAEWRAAHEAALARVERALLRGGGGDGKGETVWREAELEFFEQARVFLRGFVEALAAAENE